MKSRTHTPFDKLKKINMVLVLVVLFLSVVSVSSLWSPKKAQPFPVSQAQQNREPKLCAQPNPHEIPIPTRAPLEKPYDTKDCDFTGYEPITIKELDRASCKRISQYVIADKNHVYKRQYDPGSSDFSSYVIVSSADPTTFSSLHWGFYKDRNYLFYDVGKTLKQVSSIDVASVQVLSNYFVKDNHGVYVGDLMNNNPFTKLEGFDSATFVPLQYGENYSEFFKDKNGIYFFESPWDAKPYEVTKITEADPQSFTVLQSYELAKDKNSLFYKGKAVPDIDAPSYVELAGGYSKDAYGIYTRNFIPLPGSDPCTFELLGYTNEYAWAGYAKDAHQVYYQDVVIPGADPNTFRLQPDHEGIVRGIDKDFEYQGKYRVIRDTIQYTP